MDLWNVLCMDLCLAIHTEHNNIGFIWHNCKRVFLTFTSSRVPSGTTKYYNSNLRKPIYQIIPYSTNILRIYTHIGVTRFKTLFPVVYLQYYQMPSSTRSKSRPPPGIDSASSPNIGCIFGFVGTGGILFRLHFWFICIGSIFQLHIMCVTYLFNIYFHAYLYIEATIIYIHLVWERMKSGTPITLSGSSTAKPFASTLMELS